MPTRSRLLAAVLFLSSCTHTYTYQLGDGTQRTVTDVGATNDETSHRKDYFSCCFDERCREGLTVGDSCQSINAKLAGLSVDEAFSLKHRACRLIQGTDTMSDGTGHLGLACNDLIHLYLTDPARFDEHWNRDEVAQLACVTSGTCVWAVVLLAATEPIAESDMNLNLMYEFGYRPSAREYARRMRRTEPTLGPERDKLVLQFLTDGCLKHTDDSYPEDHFACAVLSEPPFNEPKAVARLAELSRKAEAEAVRYAEEHTPEREAERERENERARMEDERRFAREREEDAERARESAEQQARLDEQLRQAQANVGKRDTTFDGARQALEDLQRKGHAAELARIEERNNERERAERARRDREDAERRARVERDERERAAAAERKAAADRAEDERCRVQRERCRELYKETERACARETAPCYDKCNPKTAYGVLCNEECSKKEQDCLQQRSSAQSKVPPCSECGNPGIR